MVLSFLRISLEVSYCIVYFLDIHSYVLTQEEMKTWGPQKDMHTHVHCTINHNIRKLETTQISINSWCFLHWNTTPQCNTYTMELVKLTDLVLSETEHKRIRTL